MQSHVLALAFLSRRTSKNKDWSLSGANSVIGSVSDKRYILGMLRYAATAVRVYIRIHIHVQQLFGGQSERELDNRIIDS